MSNFYGAEKAGQIRATIKRWERWYSWYQVRFLVQDKLRSVRSKYQRPILQAWLDAHPLEHESPKKPADLLEAVVSESLLTDASLRIKEILDSTDIAYDFLGENFGYNSEEIEQAVTALKRACGSVPITNKLLVEYIVSRAPYGDMTSTTIKSITEQLRALDGCQATEEETVYVFACFADMEDDVPALYTTHRSEAEDFVNKYPDTADYTGFVVPVKKWTEMFLGPYPAITEYPD